MPERADESLVGRAVGPYRIVAAIGAGATAGVYRAHHRMLDRDYALKLFPPEVGRGGVPRERFMREAKALASIDHPNVVRLTDFGLTEEGRPYLVMEWVAGCSLHEELRRGPLSTMRAAEIGRGIARGLAAIHRAGAIHRDLKPGNVMLAAAGASPTIVDLGLVCGDPTTYPAVTSPNTILGTPLYMAPEAIEGSSADPRGDVYALGLIMFEMLTGRHPIPNTGFFDVLRSQLQVVPPALAPIYGDAGALVDRMLSKKAEGRPSAAEVASGFEDVRISNDPTRVVSTPDTVVIQPGGRRFRRSALGSRQPHPLDGTFDQDPAVRGLSMELGEGQDLTPVTPRELTHAEGSVVATKPIAPPRLRRPWIVVPLSAVTLASALVAFRVSSGGRSPDVEIQRARGSRQAARAVSGIPRAPRAGPVVVEEPSIVAIPALPSEPEVPIETEPDVLPRTPPATPLRSKASPPPPPPPPPPRPPVSVDELVERRARVGTRMRDSGRIDLDERYFELRDRHPATLSDRERRDLLEDIVAFEAELAR